MNPSDGVSFVGFYASFPIDQTARKVGILKTILDIEPELNFGRIEYGPLLGRLRTVNFTERGLSDALRYLETGDADYLRLFPYQVGKNWVESYKTSISVSWKSTVVRPYKRPPSPIETKFGNA